MRRSCPRARPALAFDFLPIGLRGITIAALIAALMSTLDSVLNGAASLVINDFVRARWKNLKEKALLALIRMTVVVFINVAVVWAPVIPYSSTES